MNGVIWSRGTLMYGSIQVSDSSYSSRLSTGSTGVPTAWSDSVSVFASSTAASSFSSFCM